VKYAGKARPIGNGLIADYFGVPCRSVSFLEKFFCCRLDFIRVPRFRGNPFDGPFCFYFNVARFDSVCADDPVLRFAAQALTESGVTEVRDGHGACVIPAEEHEFVIAGSGGFSHLGHCGALLNIYAPGGICRCGQNTPG
jgi:hypothetical protein